MAHKHKNVLPNTYVPVLSNKILASVLGRLPKSSLVALVRLWPLIKNTQSSTTDSNQIHRDVKAMRGRLWKKNMIIDKILHDYWPKGLNLLQLAQIDCQLIVDNPNSYLWILLTARDAWGRETPLSLDPKGFLLRLARQLSALFMCYIYVCTHPTMPLVIIRIQVFDLVGNVKNSGRYHPHISSHKPYFLAVPMNSPHVIHSPGNDIVAETVLQTVEASLANAQLIVRLDTPKMQKVVRSLESMHILKGSLRFANSMGAWTPYADGVADVSPLASISQHDTLQQDFLRESDSQEDQKRKLASIRFRGTPHNLVSEQMYDHTRLIKRRHYEDEDYDDESYQSGKRAKVDFASIAPIRTAEFEIQHAWDDDMSHVTVLLVGNDVFGGLHELAVTLDVVDVETLPGWLTGEEGLSCGIIRNGRFENS